MSRALHAGCLALALASGLARAEDTTRIDTSTNHDLGDPEALQGAWQVVRLEDSGKSELNEKKYRVSIKKDEFLVEEDGKKVERYRIKLGSTAYPKTIDIFEGNEEKKQPEVVGIYKIEGDTLTICFAVIQKERPRKFSSTAEDKLRMMVLKRMRP